MPLSKRKGVSKFVHSKLLFRLRRLAIVFLILAGILLYELAHNYIPWYMAMDGFLFGGLIGLLVSKRMHIISWDNESRKAVTKMDKIGIAILVGYLLFAISRHWLFSHWFEGYVLTALTLSIACGGMLGRLWNTRQVIRKVLKNEGYLHPNRTCI